MACSEVLIFEFDFGSSISTELDLIWMLKQKTQKFKMYLSNTELRGSLWDVLKY